MSPTWKTIGDIAREHGASIHRVEYLIRARAIRPAGRAGIIRLFDEAAAAEIGQELRRSGKPSYLPAEEEVRHA